MTITINRTLVQGSDEWLAARCGLLTASEMHLIVTPTLKAASNDRERAHLYELLAQRITKYVEPRYISDDMLRGQEDEIEAVMIYEREYAKVERVGFKILRAMASIQFLRLALVLVNAASLGASSFERCRCRVNVAELVATIVFLIESSGFKLQAFVMCFIARF